MRKFWPAGPVNVARQVKVSSAKRRERNSNRSDLTRRNNLTAEGYDSPPRFWFSIIACETRVSERKEENERPKHVWFSPVEIFADGRRLDQVSQTEWRNAIASLSRFVCKKARR